MLASDSDSDFEYPADTNDSDASDDCVLLGKLALGLDPQDMRAYDGRSTPKNGSQYLMKVMAEKKSVPKVVSFDTSKLLGKIMAGKGGGGDRVDGPSSSVHYLDKFLLVCDSSEENADNSQIFLPCDKWREETVSSFSMIRSKVEKWQYKIESREIRINEPVQLPQSNDNTHWLKFCFGDAFVKLAAQSKSKTKEQKLADFFLDVYDSSVCADLLAVCDENQTAVVKGNKLKDENQTEGKKDKDENEEREIAEVKENDAKSEVDKTDSQTNSSMTSENNGEGELEKEKVKTVECTPTPTPRSGTRPLMNVVMQLNQYQLENLVKWNLLWVRNIGLINECQGQWLYALLACLIKPVDPSIMSDLRSIARVFIKTRNSFTKDWRSHFEVKSEEGAAGGSDERVFDYINTLNLFIYVIADYFQQKDLVVKL